MAQMQTDGSELRTYLGVHGILRDADNYYNGVKFTIVEGEHEEDEAQGIDVRHFVRCCLQLKGVATSLEMQAVSFQILYLQRQLADLKRSFRQPGALVPSPSRQSSA